MTCPATPPVDFLLVFLFLALTPLFPSALLRKPFREFGGYFKPYGAVCILVLAVIRGLSVIPFFRCRIFPNWRSTHSTSPYLVVVDSIALLFPVHFAQIFYPCWHVACLNVPTPHHCTCRIQGAITPPPLRSLVLQQHRYQMLTHE